MKEKEKKKEVRRDKTNREIVRETTIFTFDDILANVVIDTNYKIPSELNPQL